jgi:hypothetical protein
MLSFEAFFFNAENMITMVVRKLFFCLLSILMAGNLLAMPDSVRTVNNTAFQRGELLVFRAAYSSRITGNIPAGTASLEIKPDLIIEDGKNLMHVVGTAGTSGVINWFFRVDNRYDTYIEEKSVAPVRFSRNIREGRYRRDDMVHFDNENKMAYSNRDTIEIPPFVQDVISAFYYARTFSMDSVEVGDAFYVDFHLSDSVYVTRILFEGYEQVRIGLGTFNTLKFKPQVQEGTVFDQPYPMTLWISDDQNKIPLLIESGLKVGAVRLELIRFGGLKNLIESFVPQ